MVQQTNSINSSSRALELVQFQFIVVFANRIAWRICVRTSIDTVPCFETEAEISRLFFSLVSLQNKERRL